MEAAASLREELEKHCFTWMEAAASLREELENTASLEWKLQLLLETS